MMVFKLCARRYDTIVKKEEMNHTWIINIVVPGASRNEEKECEKKEKFQDLEREYEDCGGHRQMV